MSEELQELSIAVEELLAAVIDNSGGVVMLPIGMIKIDRSKLGIMISYDSSLKMLALTLIDKEDWNIDE